MAEFAIPDAIDRIVAALQTTDLVVWDGPIVSSDYRNAVFVGYDGDPEGDFRAASGDQAWAGLGQKKRNETSMVYCAAVALVGDNDQTWKNARDTVFAMVQLVGQTLRADPSLGRPPPSVFEIETGEYFQELIEQGMQARLLFTIKITTRV